MTLILRGTRTFLKVEHGFYWYKMREYISRYIRTFDRCQRRKRHGKTLGLLCKSIRLGTLWNVFAWIFVNS